MHAKGRRQKAFSENTRCLDHEHVQKMINEPSSQKLYAHLLLLASYKASFGQEERSTSKVSKTVVVASKIDVRTLDVAFDIYWKAFTKCIRDEMPLHQPKTPSPSLKVLQHIDRLFVDFASLTFTHSYNTHDYKLALQEDKVNFKNQLNVICNF